MPEIDDYVIALRKVAIAAAKEGGLYGDYIVAIVHTALLREKVPMNPDDEKNV